MADPATDTARPMQTAINAKQHGILVVGRLRTLVPREFTDRTGAKVETIDAVVMADSVIYRVEVGDQLRCKALTGHVAPWSCDEESSGEQIALPCRVSAAKGRNGDPFLSFRAAPV